MKFELKKLKSGRWGVCLIQKGKEDVVYCAYRNKDSAQRTVNKYNTKEYWKKTEYYSANENPVKYNRYKKKK